MNPQRDELNPESKPESKPEDDGVPKFGRLLLVLLLGVVAMALITFWSEAYFRG